MAVKRRRINASDLTVEERRLERARLRAEAKLEAGERPLTPKEEHLLEESESSRVRALVKKHREARDAALELSPGVKRSLRQDTLARARDAARAGRQRKAAKYATMIPNYYKALDKRSKELVRDALDVTGGNKSAAASALGITVRGLERAGVRKAWSTRKGAGRRTDLGR